MIKGFKKSSYGKVKTYFKEDFLPVWEHQETRCLQTSDGYVMLVDADDYERLKDCAIRTLQVRKCEPRYAIMDYWHNNKRITVRVHRMLTKCPVDMQVDHLNHNALDNRKSNLKIVTQQENLKNRRKYLK